MKLAPRHLSFVAITIVIVAASYIFFVPNSAHYTTVAVTRATITQEVLASGRVGSPTVASLAFKGGGKIVALNAAVGEHVMAGTLLALQDSGVLNAQLAQARAQVSAATAGLDKLTVGATPQVIAVSRAQVNAAQLALTNSYASVETTLADAQMKASDAVVNQLARFFTDSKTSNPRLTFLVTDYTLSNRLTTERGAATIEIDVWQQQARSIGSTTGARDQALALADAHLGTLRALGNDAVSAVSASSGLSTSDAAAYRASAAAGLAEINAARTEIEELQHTIVAQASAVTTAQANLDLIMASSTTNDINVQQAAIAAALANAAAIAAQVHDLQIIAPFSGVVTNTNGSVGEVVGPSTVVVSLMPDAKLQVKVNVSEDNVVKVASGDPVRIELDAFPTGTIFTGRVGTIDPAETISGGAVYYQTTIVFDGSASGVRSGMTANIFITTASANDALIIPASALTTLGATTTVQVLQGATPITRTITTGISGQGGMVQVLSGLTEGEQVVTGP